MLKVGLTGGIGSGKSTVSAIIRERGIPIIDADIISREVLFIYPSILINISNVFGENFVDENGSLKRRELGSYVFQSQERRVKLEEIIIPFIKKEIMERFNKYNNKGEKICILDAPTLIEQGLHREMDKNILVWCDKVTQIKRFMQRDNMSEEESQNRINAQISLDEKRALVDYVIDNSSTIENTKEQVCKVLSALSNNI